MCIRDRYLKLYEALIGECNDESMAESTKSRGIVCHRLWNFDKLKKFNAYTLAALQNCGASIKKTFTALHLDVPLEFAKTNTLRLLNFGSVVVKKLKEGVIVVYNKAARTVTVVVECVKDPKKVKKAIARILGSVKCTVVGCYLVFDYDADGWVSMKDIGNSILKLLSLLKNADYLGGAEALYMKAISCLKSQKKEEPVTTVTE
eukprot:TRINITY_DN9263_c0_g1_i8.p1 TRINITY_DN9263_c0_g1~~TRINITY_DN9263_c0_g1_i8.p1  ORF type:complete len:204 (+),score=58.32 TRINITY_DN9263_c0_g1_i8:80-691(+)